MATSTFPTVTTGVTVETATSGALSGDGSSGNKLAVGVDGVTIDVNGSNQLEVLNAGLIHQAHVTLTNAQIKALPTTAITIVAGAGANTLIVPLSGNFLLNTTAGAYAADPGSSWLLMWASGSYIGSPIPINSMLTATQISQGNFPTVFYQAGGADFGTIVTASSSANDVADDVNVAVQIKDDWNGVSNYTLGNASNTALISLVYLVLNTTTGAFV